VMERICQPGKGLFPSPKEIKFDCSCPDWASMCKHVAAVFYGVGARLDQQPELLFTLRKVDAKELVARAGAGLPLPKQAPGSAKVLDEAKIAGIFGIEMAETAQSAPPRMAVAARKKPAVKKSPVTRKKKAAPARKKAKRKSKKQAV
jgi:uncharacterized Zn finger protein